MRSFLLFLIGPIVGAVIGCFTNYLAVKMLFRPLKPKKIGKWRIPFTPGIIPKRQPALARALGRAVSENLLTGDDLSKMILSPAFLEKATDSLLESDTLSDGGETLGTKIDSLLGQEKAKAGKETVDRELTEAIVASLSALDLGNLLLTEGKDAILSALPPFASMFITDSLLESFAAPLNQKFGVWLSENGERVLLPAIAEETSRRLNTPVGEAMTKIGIGRETVSAFLARILSGAVGDKLSTLLADLDIAGTVEGKINAMKPLELEKLVLSVMKHELNAIIWLGAVIGFILGIVTSLV